MTDQIKDIQDDIAYLKALMVEGGADSRLGGATIAAAGAVFGVAAVAHWLVQTGRVAETPWSFPAIWLGATAVFMTMLVAIKSRSGATRSSGGRVTELAWSAVGWTIFALAGSIALVCWRSNSTLPTLLFPSLILGLYGLAWMVGAAVTHKPWIWLTSIGSYLMALVVAWFSVTQWEMLIYAAALVLLAVTPGVALMRNTRQMA